jgi:3-oxoadipate enol-lactonase
MPHISLRHRSDLNLWYERSGSGPTVILLNGMSQTTANWRTQARKLSESFDVVSYDARCQGRSSAPDEALELDDHVADLASLMDSLEIPSAALVGFSHGARVALRFAAELPDRVNSMSLSGVGCDGDQLRALTIRSWRKALEFGGQEAMAWVALPDILGRRFLDGLGGAWEPMVRATVQRNSLVGLRRLIEGLEGYEDAAADARRVQSRCQLIVGADDLLVSRHSAQQLCDELGRCRLYMLRNCAHTVPIESPEEWRNLVTSFLRAA